MGDYSELRFVRLTPNGQAPCRFSQGAGGYDIFSAYDYEIYPNTQKLIKTDIAIQIPEGCFGHILPRSSLALNHSIHIMAGVVDSGNSYHDCLNIYETRK